MQAKKQRGTEIVMALGTLKNRKPILKESDEIENARDMGR